MLMIDLLNKYVDLWVGIMIECIGLVEVKVLINVGIDFINFGSVDYLVYDIQINVLMELSVIDKLKSI